MKLYIFQAVLCTAASATNAALDHWWLAIAWGGAAGLSMVCVGLLWENKR